MDARATFYHYIKQHQKLLGEFEACGLAAITRIAELIVESFQKGRCLYLCGNGGSAADCQHIAGELVGRFLRERRGLPAVALSTDSSVLSSVSNDYSFDSVFSRQVEALVRPGDVLWAISTSGSSPNILAAAKKAREQGGKIIAFTGKKNSPLETLSDISLCAGSPVSSAAQEIHQLAYHIICDLVEEAATQTNH